MYLNVSKYYKKVKNMLNKTKNNKNKGFSLLELMLVLGIIAALIVAAFMIFPKIENSRKATEEVKYIIMMKNSIVEMYSGKAEYDNSITDSRVMSNISPKGDKWNRTEWEGGFSVMPQMNNLGFSIIVRSIPQDACIKIVNQLKEQFVRIAVNDTPVVSTTKYYSAIPFDMATLTSTCKDNSDIQLDYY